MRMYLYYAWHSFLGVIRKLFRTWVAVFLLVCIAFGVVMGLLSAIFSDVPEDQTATATAEEPLPEAFDVELGGDPIGAAFIVTAGELVAGGIVLLVLGLNVFTGEKNGSHLFTMADVNLLFPSPRKPQSVLLFKLGTRIFTYVLITLYLGFQIPNFLRLGLPLPLVLALFPAWFFLLVFGQLTALLVYTLSATRVHLRKFVRPAVYTVLGLTTFSYILFCRIRGLDLWEGAVSFFNAPAARFIPIWGWIKSIPFLVYEQNWLWLGLDAAVLILTIVFLVHFIWKLDADFYEDALGFAEDLDRATREARENGKGFARLKKRERKTEAKDLIWSGEGAAIFFRKALACRARSALGGLITKTGGGYLLLAAVCGALGRFVIRTDSVLLLILPLLLAVFIRSFGNPILSDVSKSFFLLIPEKTRKKVFWSHLGGTAGTLLDLFPAFLLGWILLGSPVLETLLWFPVLVTTDFYAASFGVFTDCILPESIPKQIKTMIQVMLIYFSVLPAGFFILLGALTDAHFVFLPLASGVNFFIGAGLTALSGVVLDHGKK